MLKRKAFEKLSFWKEHRRKQGLLVTGARQVGKTYLIREFARQKYEYVVEINLLENKRAADSLKAAESTTDLLLRISLLANTELVSKKTLIFIDEVQESKDFVTAVKFLVDQGEYDFILSGSLLGVELQNIRSVPVGYLDTITMYPLDFEEFCWANGTPVEAFKKAGEAFDSRSVVPQFIHESLLKRFYEYLIVGGMPDAILAFKDAPNLQAVRNTQSNIITQYKADITRYNQEDALIIKDIYDLIPSELNQKGKRFIVKDLEKNARFGRYQECFVWLADANVALPVYLVSTARYPLKLYKSSSMFKLFMSDTGMLTSTFMRDTSLAILDKNPAINYGSIFENAVAQELYAHGVDPYYYNNKQQGEVDFVIETARGHVVPIEVKSGKSYKRHSALNNLLKMQDNLINEAFVLSDKNVEKNGAVTYLPVYMTAFLSLLE